MCIMVTQSWLFIKVNIGWIGFTKTTLQSLAKYKLSFSLFNMCGRAVAVRAILNGTLGKNAFIDDKFL